MYTKETRKDSRPASGRRQLRQKRRDDRGEGEERQQARQEESHCLTAVNSTRRGPIRQWSLVEDVDAHGYV